MVLGGLDDRWVTVRLGVADLLNAVVAWTGGPNSPHWTLVRPPLARLARIARVLDDDDAPSPRPDDPAQRVELLAAARAAVSACGQLNGPGPQREVSIASAALNTALWKIPDAEFQLEPSHPGA